jgi:hypothetical protein
MIKIPVFEGAKEIPEGQLFIAVKGSAEGRDKVTLKQLEPIDKDYKLENKKDDIAYMIKKDQDIPCPLIESIYNALMQYKTFLTLNKCTECGAELEFDTEKHFKLCGSCIKKLAHEEPAS